MDAHTLLADFARALGLDALNLSAQGTAALLVDGELTLNIEHEDDARRLLLYLSLGLPPASGREALYERLLTANLLGHGSGGGHIGFDPVRGELLLSRSLALDHTDAPALEAAAEALIGAARSLRAEVQGGGSGAAAPTGAAATTDHGAPGFMLRA